MSEYIDVGATGFAAFSLVQTLLGFLQGKGIISKAEKIELLNGLLLNLEAYPAPNDPAVEAARKLIESMIYHAERS